MGFKEGMVVKYAPKWCGEGEEKYLFVILEDYDNISSCKIGCINSPLPFGYVETVEYQMIVEA